MVETITGFSVQTSFSAFEALRKYIESHWIPLPTDMGWRKRSGWLSNLRYPVVVPHPSKGKNYWPYGKSLTMKLVFLQLIMHIILLSMLQQIGPLLSSPKQTHDSLPQVMLSSLKQRLCQN